MKQRIIQEFWTKWSTGYLQTLAHYHKWKNQTRNVKVGDIVLILDKESQKGKFTMGEIDAVKLDEDNIVRKVTVRYKLKQRNNSPAYSPTVNKYTERNVRGLALLITAEERKETENINIDDYRFSVPRNKKQQNVDNTVNQDDPSEELDTVVNDEDNEHDETVEADQPEDNVETEEEASDPNPHPNLQSLDPSSTGRKRWKPTRFD